MAVVALARRQYLTPTNLPYLHSRVSQPRSGHRGSLLTVPSSSSLCSSWKGLWGGLVPPSMEVGAPLILLVLPGDGCDGRLFQASGILPGVTETFKILFANRAWMWERDEVKISAPFSLRLDPLAGWGQPRTRGCPSTSAIQGFLKQRLVLPA